MKRVHLALLVCAALAVDSTAVSSSDLAARAEPSVTAPFAAPLILLVTGDGVAVGGVALTAQ
jgi:hypothetical protein